MFPEHRELITELKQTDAHFAKLFHEHNDLDNQIDKLERDVVKHASREDEIEKMKRKKLQLKDELYRILESKKEE
ncbi:YdcH family protein [Moraxella lincolnii]|uniref:DUF465 domain-containing protein n=1 Tax=Lwoffella lincolnii TaxID=90241 RepID=A0A1T0CEE8_9GAMM|nr:DUF465 domain-containing protein [Moraxella lincolnii]OOS20727.1 hypothetical protein B0682_06280 [Moraxella lincolnii]